MANKIWSPEKIIGLDISKEMLRVGQAKIDKKKLSSVISLERGDSENLRFENESFDTVMAAFGVRNFENLEKGLSEMNRVLEKGGTCRSVGLYKALVACFEQQNLVAFAVVLRLKSPVFVSQALDCLGVLSNEHSSPRIHPVLAFQIWPHADIGASLLYLLFEFLNPFEQILSGGVKGVKLYKADIEFLENLKSDLELGNHKEYIGDLAADVDRVLQHIKVQQRKQYAAQQAQAQTNRQKGQSLAA